MNLVTSESGLGILPAIDLRKWVKVAVRAHAVASRIDGRRDGQGEVGHYEISQTGDVRGLSWWLQDGETGGDPARGKRGLSSWRYAWPAVVIGQAAGTPGAGTTTPAGQVPADSRTPSNTVGPAGIDPYAGTQYAAATTGDRMVPLLATGLPNDAGTAPLRPVIGETWSPDERWTTKEWKTGGQGASQLVGPGPTTAPTRYFPAAWPCLPRGFYALVVASSDDDKEVETVHPTDPRLVAVTTGGPHYGSIVCDVTSDGTADETRQARLQTLCRVVRKPNGGYAFQRNSENTLALELGRTGPGEAEGGLWADGGSGREVALGMPSVRSGGPIDCVAKGCKHSRGTDADGNRLTPVHLSDKSLFRAGDHTLDGPLNFGVAYPDAVDLEFPVKVHLGWRRDVQYRLPRDAGTETFSGAWDWWTTAVIGTNTPPGTPGPPPPPPTTPGGPGTPGGQDPPTGPSTDPNGPTTPGTQPGGGIEVAPGVEPPVGGYPDNPFRGQPGELPAPPPQDVPPGVDLNDPSTWPSEWLQHPPDWLKKWLGWGQAPATKTLNMAPAHGKVELGGSKDLRPRVTGSTFTEIALTSIALRPQPIVAGERDLRYGAAATQEEIQKAESERPVVARVEAYGKQNAGKPVYTQTPGNSRARGGTGSGGLVVLPPEVDLSDVNESLGDGDGTRSISQGFVVLAPGMSLAFGVPDLATGMVVNAMTLERQTGSSDVKLRHYDGSGTITDTLTFGSALVTLAEGTDVALGSGTGTQFGTATTQKLGFHGATPTVQQGGWTINNPSTNRVLDVATDPIASVRATLGTLIQDLVNKGIIGN